MTKPSSLSASTLPSGLLEDGDYLSLIEFERRYETMPGLTKAELIEGVAAMTRFDMATVLKVLQQGIESPAHAAFVAKLAGK